MQNLNIQYFRTKLLSWNRLKNRRKMPWKGEKDPYKIWLSEVILQQTRVEQGLKYYEKFIRNYPDICALADAEDDNVLKNWEGLGYYSRCRNLIHTARYICYKLNGVFPREYPDILMLKGVGEYTAAAIASFAYNKAIAVVDGNVIRVLSRFNGIQRSFKSVRDKKYYQEVANKHISKRIPATYNQAIMDFGATVCKPVNPDCTVCPLHSKCYAFRNDLVKEFPLRSKSAELKKRYFHYIIIHDKSSVYIRKRGSGDIWQALYEPYLVEQKAKPDWIKGQSIWKAKQKLSHQELHFYFYVVEKSELEKMNLQEYSRTSLKTLSKKAFPKTVFDFFKEFEYI